MKTIHNSLRLLIICSAILVQHNESVFGATLWSQGTSGTSTTITGPYSGTSGGVDWDYDHSGTLTSSKTTTRLQSVASSGFVASALTAVAATGSKTILEAGLTEAHSTWSYGGAPGTSPAVGFRVYGSISKSSGSSWGAYAYAYVDADFSNTSASAIAYSQPFFQATGGAGAGVTDQQAVYASAAGSQVNGATPSLGTDILYDTGASIFNNYENSTPASNGVAEAYTDYTLSVDHSYSTATGLSTVNGTVEVGFVIDSESSASYSGSPWVLPGAVAYAELSMAGTMTMDVTLP